MRYYIITYGCQMNKSDSQRIALLLEKSGYKPAKNEKLAHLLVINICSVRQAAVDRAYDKINKFYKNKKIILAGCVLEKDKKELQDKVAAIWRPDDYFDLPPLPQNESSAFVPIMTGCNNFCSYCAVPYTRGREKSRLADEVIDEIKSLIKNGYKEIILLGQNVNSYSHNIKHITGNKKIFPEQGVKPSSEAKLYYLAKRRVEGSTKIYPSTPPPTGGSAQEITFSRLLKTINDLPGNFQLSFLTSHPKDMTDELIEIIAECEKIMPSLHLPVQSGDNKILSKMNRHYTVAHYKKLIKKIRAAFKKSRPASPPVAISTDIIVGFPSETKKQFQNTVKLAKEIKFDKAYIAKYSPRSGTAAAKLKDDVPPEEKKRRWMILEELINKPNLSKK